MKIPAAALPAFVLAIAAAPGAWAQASCSSDFQPRPAALLERFTSADCENCWASPDTRSAAAGELALDWIVPTARGEDAPLSAAATRDALARLRDLDRPGPAPLDTVRTRVKGAAPKLRVAHGLAFNGYIGASIELEAKARGDWTAYLALVETLPAGTEGSAVERNLVRNVLRAQWAAGGTKRESRPMSIPEGANPQRLRVVGWVVDGAGTLRGIAQSRCAP